ncbi:MAG: imelysin family protein [Myxococcales bacterium]|nr:imelysin family protein [Myxococcales bacterium]MDD9970548.1 imelysin family protein [Myxococcales bacterium]
MTLGFFDVVSAGPWRRAFRCLVAVLVIAGCGGGADGDDPDGDAGQGQMGSLEAALRSAVDESIIPAVEDFARGARGLETSVDAFCEAPSDRGLVALQDEWLDLSRSWNRVGIYFLGPLDEDIIMPSMIFIESMRQRGMDYTDTVRETLAAAVSETDPLDDTFFEGLTFNRVGMLALEVLLFEESSADPPAIDPADIAQRYLDHERQCDYLQGVARLLRERADGVEAGWTDEFLDTGLPFRELLLRDMLADGSEPVNALLLAAIKHLEYLRLRKLDGVVDLAVAGRARPELSPFWDNLAAGLDALEGLMDPPGSDAGFFLVMMERGFEAEVDVARDSFEGARKAVEAEDREQAAAAFLVLETSLRREVPLGLGVDLGITFTDGD